MKRALHSTGLLLLAAFATAPAQPAPELQTPMYMPECWRGAEAYGANGWTTDVYPDTGLFAICEIDPNETGYPFHSGVVKGVSDTTVLSVQFKNRNQTAYNISSQSPETWFTPAIWPVGVDIWQMPALTLPATFGWRFDHWLKDLEDQVLKPTTIPSEFDLMTIDSYSLVFYCWGLPPGRYQLMMAKTAQAPASFKLLKSDIVPVWVMQPTSLADTLSAYAACFDRAMDKKDKSGTGYWASQILLRNPSSILGYLLKSGWATLPPQDTTAFFAAVDSVRAIIMRYGDPLLPDSSNMSGWLKVWYDDRRNWADYVKNAPRGGIKEFY